MNEHSRCTGGSALQDTRERNQGSETSVPQVGIKPRLEPVSPPGPSAPPRTPSVLCREESLHRSCLVA